MVHVWRTFVLFTTCPTITKEGEPGSYLNTRIAVFTVGVKQTDPRVRGYGRPPYVGGTVTCHVAAALNTSPTHRKVTGQDAQLGHYSVGFWYSPVTRVKFLTYDPFQAKFRRVMAVLGKTWANAKG